MAGLETNVYPILNLDELSARYRLYRIRGLSKGGEYYQNRQEIGKRISIEYRTPATVIDRDGTPHLVLRDDVMDIPEKMSLVRGTAYFDRLDNVFPLDFTRRDPTTDTICLRFLRFAIQNALNARRELWQPGRGRPFFERTPQISGDVAIFRGFRIRPVIAPEGRIGICVDCTSRYVSKKPLPMEMTSDSFRKYRQQHFIYHFGADWYDVRLDDLADVNVSEYTVPTDTGQVPLINYIMQCVREPIPQELADLPHDASVAYYMNSSGETRAVPTGLCYQVLDTQHRGVQRHQNKAMLSPPKRRQGIQEYMGRFLMRLRFGTDGTIIRISPTPVRIRQRMFQIPDYEFGNGYKLSVRNSPDAEQVSLEQIGRKRRNLLLDRIAGFYRSDPLDQPQYLVLPESVYKSWGRQYVNDLIQAVRDLFPHSSDVPLGKPYKPEIVTYSDFRPRTFVDQGKAILEAVREHNPRTGCALVMVHHVKNKKTREHDELSAMVVSRLFKKFGIRAAVNHSRMGSECYELVDGDCNYRIGQDKRRRLLPYLTNVALNKILLVNERWPFVLGTPLHADLTVGIDVKGNTAGFTLINRRGNIIHPSCKPSRQREKLTTDQVSHEFARLVRQEAQAIEFPARNIVVHRDGRSYESEIEGLRRAMDSLRQDGTIDADAKLTVLEVAKTSPAPLRLFDVGQDRQGNTRVSNPQVGCYYMPSEDEAYLCTTGKPFKHPGTAKPIHVRRVEGEMPLVECLEDFYSLSTLTWTRPEDCTRNPITIKLTDRYLGEDASEYDDDALESGSEEEDEGE